MEIITGTSNKVDGHIDNDGWDILDSLRRATPPADLQIKKDDMLTKENVDILARTRIELDGDVFFLLKSENGVPTPLSKEVMEFHKLGIDISVKNWQKIFLAFTKFLTLIFLFSIKSGTSSTFSKCSCQDKHTGQIVVSGF